MAKLGGLINGQDVAFDTHQAGDGQGINWKHLHLEKRLHKGGAKARFPLFGEEPPSSRGMNERELNRVSTEIRSALKNNRDLVEDLAETIAEQLRRFSSGEAEIHHARQAAQRIAGAFDLNESFLRAVEEYYEGKIFSFTSIHFNPAQNSLHEIVITGAGIAVQKPRRHNSLRRIDPRC